MPTGPLTPALLPAMVTGSSTRSRGFSEAHLLALFLTAADATLIHAFYIIILLAHIVILESYLHCYIIVFHVLVDL
jgi:hypothetical protein